MRILISSYACSPFMGSEPGVGWGFVNALAKHHELWVIVEEEKFRNDIDKYVSKNPEILKSVHFYYIRKKRNRLLRKFWPPSYYWYYRQWHVDAFNLGKKLHCEVQFDLVHQLTMVGFREPGYLWKLGVPFVWGPVGGMGLFPLRFLPAMGWGGGYYLAYNVVNLWQMHFSVRPRMAARVAGKGLIAATPENQLGALKYWGVSSALMCEVGVPQTPLKRLVVARDQNKPLRLVWTGVHVRRKALNIALRALATLSKDLKWELHILGKGVLTKDWILMSKRLGIYNNCHFHYWLERSEVLKVMLDSHVMLITSLRDLTSTVTVESLACGLPIVCLDHCGFAGVVDDTCGIKVEVTTPNQVVRDFAAAVTRLATDEAYRQNIAHGAQQKASELSWEQKAIDINSIYQKKTSS
ncbi:glycosyltransferase family 4 protein [Leucothrix pacifica]|uniref:Glycosyl transferase family 1 domain-containing protein n=1 Tax=Leucothrix pacifica TaxID=1247513 RepID=A0A317CB82_9GAMM|nr:glycosyltransferase family 4 protein [Leucothrix pacifica]PWQ95796.1 hypothetical protein DKW60_13925 [Leucothrix pacifica]